MPSAVTEAAESESAPGMPAEGVRTVVTLFLLFHLFAVGLGIMTSDYGGPGLLRDIVARTPGLGSYIAQFRFDRSYDYHLMNDQPLDWDHRLEATVKYADGHADPPIVLPDPTIWPSERQQRYQRLAWHIAMFAALASDEDSDAAELNAQRKMELPKSIGGGLLKQHPGATSVSLRCIYHAGINRIVFLTSTDTRERDPDDSRYFATDVDGTIVLDHDQPTYFENLPIAEVSPVHIAQPVKSRSNAVGQPTTSDSQSRGSSAGSK